MEFLRSRSLQGSASEYCTLHTVRMQWQKHKDNIPGAKGRVDKGILALKTSAAFSLKSSLDLNGYPVDT